MLRARCMLYCICRKPFDPGRMIACYRCSEWYHFDCMKLSCTQDIYICPACNPCTGLPTNHDRSDYCIFFVVALKFVLLEIYIVLPFSNPWSTKSNFLYFHFLKYILVLLKMRKRLV